MVNIKIKKNSKTNLKTIIVVVEWEGRYCSRRMMQSSFEDNFITNHEIQRASIVCAALCTLRSQCTQCRFPKRPLDNSYRAKLGGLIRFQVHYRPRGYPPNKFGPKCWTKFGTKNGQSFRQKMDKILTNILETFGGGGRGWSVLLIYRSSTVNSKSFARTLLLRNKSNSN